MPLENYTVKYFPKSIDEFLGNKPQLFKVINYIKNPIPGKALLLYGPPGTGKTASVYLAAKITNAKVIETNASDTRNLMKIKELAEGVGQQRILFSQRHVILLDEVDGISSSFEERGAIYAITELINKAKYPIILTANDAYEKKLSPLWSICEMIKFNKVPSREIFSRLKFIAEEEGLKIDEKALKFIADRSNGDVRGALNDLQILASKKERISYEDALNILGYREYDKEIFEALPIIFKTEKLKTALMVASQLNIDLDMLFEWIRENITVEYKDIEDIANAYYYLSLGDLYRKLIVKRQNWKFLAYANEFTIGGVAVAKKQKYPGFTKYRYPLKLKILKETKEERGERKEEISELSKKLHASTKKVREHYGFLLEIMEQHKKK